jgi:hypothetical protein
MLWRDPNARPRIEEIPLLLDRALHRDSGSLPSDHAPRVSQTAGATEDEST